MGKNSGKRRRQNPVPTVPPASTPPVNPVEQTLIPVASDSGSSAATASDTSDYLTQEAYDKERDILLDLQNKNADEHNKQILTLTAGILGLTITFISNIAPNPPPQTMIWLVLGWGGLVVSMAAMMTSFMTGQFACMRARDLLDKHATEGVRPVQINRWSQATTALNAISHVFFLAGIILVAYFSGLNLLVYRKPPEANTNQAGPMADTPKVPPATLPAPPSAPTSNPGTDTTPPPSPPVVPTDSPPSKK